MKVSDLKTEYIENPLGIVTTVPRLSWILEFGSIQSGPIGLSSIGCIACGAFE